MWSGFQRPTVGGCEEGERGSAPPLARCVVRLREGPGRPGRTGDPRRGPDAGLEVHLGADEVHLALLLVGGDEAGADPNWRRGGREDERGADSGGRRQTASASSGTTLRKGEGSTTAGRTSEETRVRGLELQEQRGRGSERPCQPVRFGRKAGDGRGRRQLEGRASRRRLPPRVTRRN